MPSQENIDKVQEIKSVLEDASAVWLVDYRGLTVKQVQQLRHELREAGAQMKVYKNTLTGLALKELDLPTMEEYLAGPNGFVFATGDIAASAKVLKNFAKKNEDLEIRAGLVGADVMNTDQVMAIADLPSREELIAKFLGTINNPASKIVRVLNEPMASFARTLGAIAANKDAA